MHGVKLLVRNSALGTITFTTSQPSIALFLAGRSHAVAGGYQGSVAGTAVQLSVGPGGTTSIPVVATALRWQNGATTAVESQKDLPPGNYALIAYLHLDRLKNGASSQIAAAAVPVKVVAH